ncbi:hypothetical protein SteCoe_30963 [Stentor coeruleus]|uniref:Uncharacterized protein n=1 Tax=Stentor coeruleus TaxID=5963 RepID=A0A1R2B2V2_9CILI|nr:hypothetical protein SteCoe_30963 [Stentor coeruleus]
MHKRSLSFNSIESRRGLSPEPIRPIKKDFGLPSCRQVTSFKRPCSVFLGKNPICQQAENSMRNIDFIVDKCQSELKKIRKISIKIKRSTRKLMENRGVIERMINKPLFSIGLLIKEKPRFLNRYLKYQ